VSFHATGGLPARYAVKTRWEDVRPETKLPLLRSVNEKTQAADPRVRKVRVYFVDESGAVLLADSDGKIVEDLQPMTIMGLTCITAWKPTSTAAAEAGPDVGSEVEGEVLEQSLSDAAQLNVAVTGEHLAADQVSVALGLHVEVLVAGAAWDGSHELHPEVVGVAAEGVKGLTEADLDFETVAVEGDDLEWIEGGVGAEEDDASAGGVACYVACPMAAIWRSRCRIDGGDLRATAS
jgi:hypothetical protein